MKFSFSENHSAEIDFELEQTDIFCFFHSQNSILIPQELWFPAVLTTLRMKKNVLILEDSSKIKPSIDLSLRWQAEVNSLWLAPPSLSVLLEATKQISTSYSSMKVYLTTFK